MRRLLGAVAVAAALAGGALALFGRGGEHLARVAGDPIAVAAERTAAVTSEHVVYDIKVSVGGKTTTMLGDGDFAETGKLGRGTLTVGRTSFDFAQRGTVLYMHSDAIKKSDLHGKTWFKMDYGKTAKAVGVNVGVAADRSPKAALAQLRHTGQVRKGGVDSVDGVRATHYRAQIDPSVVPAKLEALAHPRYGPLDVWISADGMLRRLRLDYQYEVDGKTLRMILTMTFSRFGERVGIATPPESDVYDATSDALTSMAGGTP